MRRTIALSAAALAALSAAHADGLKDRFAVSGSVGTLGGQIEAHGKINKYLSVRGGYNYLEFDLDETYDDIDYTVTTDLTGGLLAVDVHPFGNGFVLSAGAHIGGKTFDLSGLPSEGVEIGDTFYTPEEIGEIRGEADLGGTAPYLGFGYNGAFSNGRYGFTAMIGALLLEDPTVDLSTTGLLSEDPSFQADLEAEEDELQDDIDEFPFWPVASIGFVVRF